MVVGCYLSYFPLTLNREPFNREPESLPSGTHGFGSFSLPHYSNTSSLFNRDPLNLDPFLTFEGVGNGYTTNNLAVL